MLGWVLFTSSIAEVGADPAAGAGMVKCNVQAHSVVCSKTVTGQGGEPPARQRSQELCWQVGSLAHGNLSTTSLVYRRNKMPEWYCRRWLNLLKEDKEQILAKGMIQGKIRNTF